MVDPNYFRAAGIPLLRGREFTSADRKGSRQVAIINQALADILFAGESPIDRRIAWTGDLLRFAPFNGDWRTIVGVVGNTHDAGLDAAPPALMYMVFAQEFIYSGGLVVRADSNVSGLAGAATRIVRRLAPGVPIEKVRTVAQIKDQSVAPRRLNAVLVWSFGFLALIIAAVGIAGVLAFSVSTRINEIGVRMSLGAAPGQVQRMILSEGGGAAGARTGPGPARRVARGARDSGALVRRRAVRSRDVRRGRDRDGGHRDRSVLDSGAAGVAGGPGRHHASAVDAADKEAQR